MQSRAPNCNLRHHNAAQGTKLQPGTSQCSPGHQIATRDITNQSGTSQHGLTIKLSPSGPGDPCRQGFEGGVENGHNDQR